jgi:tetratricopeptide (TPR) repeat protein
MANPLPPASTDVARALLEAGGAAAARRVLEAARRRSGIEGEAARRLLARLERGDGPEPSVLPLDLALVRDLLDRERLVEAQAVIAYVPASTEARRIAELLSIAMGDGPARAEAEDEARLQALAGLIEVGHVGLARQALREVVDARPDLPAWLIERLTAIEQLLDGSYARAVEDPGEGRASVLAHLEARDLFEALRAARAAEDGELLEPLERLVDALQRPSESPAVPDRERGDSTEELPLVGVAELQLRMGRLEEAEGCYRRHLADHPDDERALARVRDIGRLRRALGESVLPLPPRRTASPAVASKKTPPRTNRHAWRADGGRPSFHEGRVDVTGRLDAAREAELMVRLGRIVEARFVYRLLAMRTPDDPAIAARLEELEALLPADA